jgi:hypothetical protein
MAEPSDDFTAYYEKLQRQTEKLPVTILVLAAQPVSFGEVLIQREPRDS